jgi:hypothetical protein
MSAFRGALAFFWGRESGIHPFWSRRLPDYFYEYNAPKKTIKLKFLSLISLVR